MVNDLAGVVVVGRDRGVAGPDGGTPGPNAPTRRKGGGFVDIEDGIKELETKLDAGLFGNGKPLSEKPKDLTKERRNAGLDVAENGGIFPESKDADGGLGKEILDPGTGATDLGAELMGPGRGIGSRDGPITDLGGRATIPDEANPGRETDCVRESENLGIEVEAEACVDAKLRLLLVSGNNLALGFWAAGAIGIRLGMLAVWLALVLMSSFLTIILPSLIIVDRGDLGLTLSGEPIGGCG